MGKKILFTEEQLKKYIKLNLNEGLLQQIQAGKEASQKSEEEQRKENEKEYKRLANLVKKDWPYDDEIQLSDADLHIGTDTTKMTFSAWLSSHGYAPQKSQVAIQNILSKARAIIMGNTLSAEKDIKAGKGDKHHRKEGESVEDFKRRHIAGATNREAFDKKVEMDQKDAKFKEGLTKLAMSGDEKLPRCGNFDLSQDSQFQNVLKFCNENHIICTNSGDIYIPIKIKASLWRQLKPEEQRNSDMVIQCLSDNIEKMRYDSLMSRYGRCLNKPIIRFVGLGGDNKSNVIYTFFIPEKWREMV